MIRIRSLKDGFRRCGTAHPSAWTEYRDDFFAAGEWERLRAEPMLQVETAPGGADSAAPPDSQPEVFRETSADLKSAADPRPAPEPRSAIDGQPVDDSQPAAGSQSAVAPQSLTGQQHPAAPKPIPNAPARKAARRGAAKGADPDGLLHD